MRHGDRLLSSDCLNIASSAWGSKYVRGIRFRFVFGNSTNFSLSHSLRRAHLTTKNIKIQKKQFFLERLVHCNIRNKCELVCIPVGLSFLPASRTHFGLDYMQLPACLWFFAVVTNMPHFFGQWILHRSDHVAPGNRS